MRLVLLAILSVFVMGCASTPYVDMKVVHQIDSWSDWVLQPERKWMEDSEDYGIRVTVGTEFAKERECFVEFAATGTEQMFVGCGQRFGWRGSHEPTGWYAEPSIRYQVDTRTTEFLRTDQKQWQGENPFIHLRVGYKRNGIRCPVVATGKSLVSGAPFSNEDTSPDIYWTNVECGVRMWGRDGVFSDGQ